MSTGDSTQQGLGTVRIEVELEKTGDDSFPEFSYVALTEELNKNRPNVRSRRLGFSNFPKLKSFPNAKGEGLGMLVACWLVRLRESETGE